MKFHHRVFSYYFLIERVFKVLNLRDFRWSPTYNFDVTLLYNTPL